MGLFSMKFTTGPTPCREFSTVHDVQAALHSSRVTSVSMLPL